MRPMMDFAPSGKGSGTFSVRNPPFSSGVSGAEQTSSASSGERNDAPKGTQHAELHHLGPSRAVFLPDPDAARKEATGIFADLARDIATKLPSNPNWRI